MRFCGEYPTLHIDILSACWKCFALLYAWWNYLYDTKLRNIFQKFPENVVINSFMLWFVSGKTSQVSKISFFKSYLSSQFLQKEKRRACTNFASSNWKTISTYIMVCLCRSIYLMTTLVTVTAFWHAFAPIQRSWIKDLFTTCRHIWRRAYAHFISGKTSWCFHDKHCILNGSLRVSPSVKLPWLW